MTRPQHPSPFRRSGAAVARAMAALVLTAVVAACAGSAASPAATTDPTTTAPATVTPVTATPSAAGAGSGIDCSALVVTPAQTEGPYYTPGAPMKDDLRESGMPGQTLVVSGYVLTADCEPIAGALIDIWQADADGVYDSSGYRLRGVVETASDGSYTFTTVVPGQYPGRTEHIHVKVTPPGGATLTTQLYFPGSTANSADGIFRPETVLTITESGDALLGRYDFVLAQ